MKKKETLGAQSPQKAENLKVVDKTVKKQPEQSQMVSTNDSPDKKDAWKITRKPQGPAQ